jgi:hypothetical protein
MASGDPSTRTRSSTFTGTPSEPIEPIGLPEMKGDPPEVFIPSVDFGYEGDEDPEAIRAPPAGGGENGEQLRLSTQRFYPFSFER